MPVGALPEARHTLKTMNDRENDSPPDGPLRVNIFGQVYALRSRGGEEQALRAAEMVDERMRLIASQLSVHDVAKVAVLAALNLADEVRALRDYYEEEVAQTPQDAEAEKAALPPPSGRPDARGGSWFEAIFDADAFDEVSGDRMSRQLTSKLQGLRQPRREQPPPPAKDGTPGGEAGGS